MSKALLLLIIVVSFAGCRKQKLVGPKEDQTYVRLLFPDQASCNQFQQNTGGMMFNCHQSLVFKKNNEVSAMVTDIINRGSYTQVDNMIFVDFSGPNDVPGSMMIL